MKASSTSTCPSSTVDRAAGTAPYGYLTKPHNIREPRASEEKFRNAFDFAPLGMAMVGHEGDTRTDTDTVTVTATEKHRPDLEDLDRFKQINDRCRRGALGVRAPRGAGWSKQRAPLRGATWRGISTTWPPNCAKAAPNC